MTSVHTPGEISHPAVVGEQGGMQEGLVPRQVLLTLPEGMSSSDYKDFCDAMGSRGVVVEPLIEPIGQPADVVPQRLGKLAVAKHEGEPRPLATLAELSAFAEGESYPKGASTALTTWNALRRAEDILGEAKVYVPQLTEASPREQIQLGGRGLWYRVADVREMAKLDLRFPTEYIQAEDRLDEPRLDLLSLLDTLRYLLRDGYKQAPALIREVGENRLSLLAHFLNQRLKPEEPLPTLPGYPPARVATE